MLPSPTDLHYFLEAANTQNFSRAAERLGITQPSLSLAIQRLEADLGEKVFLRSKRGVTLTQGGKLLLIQTRNLLEVWNGVRADARGSMQTIKGSYILGCHPSVALYSLSLFLPKVLVAHPDLQVDLVHDLSRKITEGVVTSRIDLGIVVNPQRHPDLLIKKLADDDVGFWVRDGKKQEGFSDRGGKGHILIYDPELIQSQVLLKKAVKSGFNPTRIIKSRSLEVVAELTASGCGIGVLPSRVAERSSKKIIPLAGAPFYRDEICLVMRVENKSVAAMRCLAEAVAEGFLR